MFRSIPPALRLFAFLVGILAVALALTGCAVPEEVRRLETESTASIEAYHANAETAVAGLLNAYEEVSLRELDAVTTLVLHEETKEVPVVIGEGPPAVEGGPPTPRIEKRKILDPVTVAEALKLYREGIGKVRVEREEFAEAWVKAQGDYLDAIELRRTLKEYLQRGGVEPEDIDALSETLAREIAKRKKS